MGVVTLDTWQLVISLVTFVTPVSFGRRPPFFDSDHHFWFIVFLVRRHCTPSMPALRCCSVLSMGWKLKQIKLKRAGALMENGRATD